MSEIRRLRNLARMYGVQTAYLNVEDELCEASAETLLATLKVLGAPLDGMEDVPDALRARRRAVRETILEPVTVAWEGAAAVDVCLTEAQAKEQLWFELTLEDGGRLEWTRRLGDLRDRGARRTEGETYLVRRFELPERLPWGYHRLTLETGREVFTSLVIAAPVRAYQGEAADEERLWGFFLPLYALYRETSWGAGDISDLEEMISWVARQGGNLVATLPMLAWQSELRDDPSPYAPTSRLFWNDFYLDVRQIPEFASCREAQEFVAAEETQRELDELRGARYVDYPRVMALKRQVLKMLAREFFSDNGQRGALETFCREHPEVEDFAKFRAVAERKGRHWPHWEEPLRSGRIDREDYGEAAHRFYLYVQWQVHRQLEELSGRASEAGLVWYLDFPLGVSRDGYDVWREREAFALGADGGAPPDSFFTRGQCWGFPPMHPERLRQQEYRYFIRALRRHMKYAGLLRIDHAMSLYRLFWIPDGMEAKDGAYVRYPAEELFAILTLESHRTRTRVCGENLGTVPPQVDEAMARHGILDMYVMQYEAHPAKEPPLRPLPNTSVASLNTHDMPTFKAHWDGLDVPDRVDLGLLDERGAAEELARRADSREKVAAMMRKEGWLDAEADPTDAQAVLEALLKWLAASRAPLVLASLEDLWGETEPQNTPGTLHERINWRRKAQYSLEQFRELPFVERVAAEIDRCRRSASGRDVPRATTEGTDEHHKPE